jgi:FAD/FMN-containing dehydrogenase
MGGVVSETGVAGLTVAGGVGCLRAEHGMTIDNVIAMQGVTANGNILKCDKENHTDLFCALRGGGGGYALVTSFTLKVCPIPEEHFTIMWAWDGELFPKILAASWTVERMKKQPL